MASQTTKGLPYPTSTDLLTTGAAAIQALAQDLDFTKIPLLSPTATTVATPLETYPVGLSLIVMAGADSAAGGWPTGLTGHVLTVKTNTNRAAQYFFRAGTPNVTAYYRQLYAVGTPHSAWVAATAPYGMFVGSVVLNAATNPTAGVVVTFPANRFTLPPRVVTGSANSAWVAAATSITATSCTVIGRQIIANSSDPVISIMAGQATDQGTNG